MPGQTQLRVGANSEVALLTLTAATASVAGIDQSNLYSRGVTVVIDVTAITGTTPSLIVSVDGKDPTSGKYFALLASASITAVGTYVIRVYPEMLDVANVSAKMPLPKTFRVRATIAGTTPSVTATIGGILSI